MLSSLTPKPLWQLFSQICAIPHPSHHEQMITQFIVDFAIQHHLEYEIDDTGNILLRKVATAGMENAPSIALQAHLDMVPQKNEDTEHDFLTDPIQVYIDGEWVKAKGTTLGADNGIGLASALAVLIDQQIEHGPLEVLLTTSEETGMVGAFGLKPDWLKSHYLINTDSEQEGEIFTGCAGGVEFKQFLPIGYADIPQGHDVCVELAIKGLKGGHSGVDIHLGRGNATKLLIRFLAEFVDDIDYRIADFSGGSLRNAIPREAFITLTLRQADFQTLVTLMQRYSAILNHEYAQTEPNLVFTQQLVEKNQVNRVISHDHQAKIIDWLHTAPHGVIRMSDQMAGVVETSLNLGVVDIKENKVSVYYLIRSLVDSAKDAVVSTLISHSQLVGLEYQISGGYPGWQPDPHSALLNLTKSKYQELFSAKAKVMVIHAGLECGLFKTPYPEMDMVSIGPTIVSPHSPDEKVNISSVARYWSLLVATLKSVEQLK